MIKSPINKVSKKRAAQLKMYRDLVWKLVDLCENTSELSGKSPSWQFNFVEAHHINKRNGERLLDAFGIIMLTHSEHMVEQGQEKGEKHSKEYLLQLVREIRIKQGFKEV